MEKYLTVKEVQEKLRLGKNATYKLVNKNGFPKIVIGKKIIIPEKELDKYILSHIGSEI